MFCRSLLLGLLHKGFQTTLTHTRVEKYLEGGNPALRVDGKIKEFELRFGNDTKNGGGRPISKLD